MNWTPKTGSRQMIAWSFVFISFALGCSRSPILDFAPDHGIAELPERHQASISDGLLRLFGTPANPRLRIADPDAEEPEEGAPIPLIDVSDPNPRELRHGAEVYNARCAGCHGITGDGAGPAGEHLQPRPRDYRRGIFKFTSTPYGRKPARHDLVRTIRRGAKGTSMPAFAWMSEEDLQAVIDYIVFLSLRGEVERYAMVLSDEFEEDEDMDFYEFTDTLDASIESWDAAINEAVQPATAEPLYSEETVKAGRTLFLKEGCASCHGVDGKGQIEWLNPEFLAQQQTLPDDQRIKINYDAWEFPAPAADLTARMLHGGRRPIDIYRRIYTGINGTPMPAFAGAFADRPAGIWHLVHYVRHIIEGGDPTAGIAALPKAIEAADETDATNNDATDSSDASANDSNSESDE